MIVEPCPACNVRVVFKDDGSCPNCQARVKRPAEQVSATTSPDIDAGGGVSASENSTPEGSNTSEETAEVGTAPESKKLFSDDWQPKRTRDSQVSSRVEQPIAIRVCAYFLVVNGLINFCILVWFFSTTAGDNAEITSRFRALTPTAQRLELGRSFGATFVLMVVGVGLLREHEWARKLYATWVCVNIPLSFAVARMSNLSWSLPPLAGYAVVLYFLFRPLATEYFDKVRFKQGLAD